MQKIIKSYKDVFSDSIGDRPMDCTPVKLVIDETLPKPPNSDNSEGSAIALAEFGRENLD